MDAVSFLISALLVRTIAQPESSPAAPTQSESLTREIGAGLQALLRNSLVHSLIISATIAAVFKGAVDALYVPFASRDLALNPATIGSIFTIGGLCAIPGAILAPWAAERVDVGWAIIGGWTLAALAALLVPLAAGPVVVVAAILVTARGLDGLTEPVANIHQGASSKW